MILLIKKFLKVLFVLYVLSLIYILFLCRINQNTIKDVNLELFSTINRYIRALKNNYKNKYLILMNLFGNFALFIPLGFFIRSLFYKKIKNFFEFFLTTFIIIISIEILQFIFSVGTADIDDVILNLLGATISYIIFRNIKI